MYSKGFYLQASKEWALRTRPHTSLLTCTQEVLCSNPARDPANLTEVFPQFLQANAGVVLWLGHNHLLTKPFQFIFCHPATDSMWSSTDCHKKPTYLSVFLSKSVFLIFPLSVREEACIYIRIFSYLLLNRWLTVFSIGVNGVACFIYFIFLIIQCEGQGLYLQSMISIPVNWWDKLFNNVTFFLDMCSLLDKYKCFRAPCCLHLHQGVCLSYNVASNLKRLQS